jgi:adenylate cyclase
VSAPPDGPDHHDPDDRDPDDRAEESARSALRAMLLALGTDPAEIDEADAGGTLTLLGVEKLIVPEPARFDLADVTARTGLSEEMVGQLWRSLGHAAPCDGERIFTETDVEIMAKVGDLLAADEQTAPLVLQMSRVIGSSIARIASAQIEAISGPSAWSGAGGRDPLSSERVVRNTGALLPVMPRVLESAWRRHLQDAARRRILATTADEQPSVTVGFADLVGFTALSQQVNDVELAAIVDQFEDLVFDVITAGGGRVVKTIGDEVMFVGLPDEVVAAALALCKTAATDPALLSVRGAVAAGPVVSYNGDFYGPVVNLASRLTDLAKADEILAAGELRPLLADDTRYQWVSHGVHRLRGIGAVETFALKVAG